MEHYLKNSHLKFQKYVGSFHLQYLDLVLWTNVSSSYGGKFPRKSSPAKTRSIVKHILALSRHLANHLLSSFTRIF